MSIKKQEKNKKNWFNKLNNEKSIEKLALIHLMDLGINFNYLIGKKVLEIGAGKAIIAKAAKNKGIEGIVSLDVDPEVEEELKNLGLPFVRARAEELPFPDETFDLVISHAGPPIISSSKEIVKKVILEVKRVLKEGGEFRFGPGSLNTNIFTQEELFTPEEYKSFTQKQRIERIKQKSIEFLKSIDPNINQEKNKVGHHFQIFYILKKEKNVEK
jgi:ubiquinone/menaquinone biosynthesis C-methylase UbiE